MNKSIRILMKWLTFVMIIPISAHADNFVRTVQGGDTGIDKGFTELFIKIKTHEDYENIFNDARIRTIFNRQANTI